MYTRLKDLREDHDLTQIDCAKIAFISKNSYIRYEKNEREVPADVLMRFAKYYNVSMDYICGLTNNKEKYW
ncbi:MAG: helix-turn-helix transcriptional regulator [Ruminococcus sp.]|nr:helix-turn-helix transcriptional regulator [Ruminococcus sp.]